LKIRLILRAANFPGIVISLLKTSGNFSFSVGGEGRDEGERQNQLPLNIPKGLNLSARHCRDAGTAMPGKNVKINSTPKALNQAQPRGAIFNPNKAT
jgi:hypothetical protein